jgi:PAS domain S-box-containing protein
MKWLQERINQIVSASNPITDVDDSTRVRLLNIFITTSLVASTIIFLLAIITKDLPETMRLTSPFYLVFLLILRYISRHGRVRFASIALVVSSTLGITVVLATLGTIRDPWVVYYLFGCIAAGLLVGRRTAIITAVITSIIILVLVYAELNQWLPEPVESVTLTQAFILISASVLTVILLNIAIGSRDDALVQLREELERRKQAEQALKESEERFRLISSVASDYTFSSRLDADGDLEHILLTGAFEAITGYTKEEFLALGGWRATLHPDDIAEDERAIGALRRNERTFSEVRTITKAGDVRWVRVSAQPIWHDEQERLIGINGGVQDITERKELELQLQQYNAELETMVRNRTDALQRAKEQIELIINNTSDAILFADARGDVVLTNPAFSERFGQNGISAIEGILGSLVDEDQIASISEAILDAIHENTQRHIIVQVQSPHDASVRDVDVALIPVASSSADGRDGVLLSGRDITQQREIERFKERFVTDALHDLATPISALTTRTYLLKRNPQKLDVHLDAMQNQVQHLRSLLENLRTLSRIDRAQLALERSICDLNQLVRRVHDTYEPVALDKQQILQLELDLAMPQINLDAQQIERVLVNLVSNAVHYTPQDRAITIRTQIDAQHVVVSVIDQGLGIHEDEKERVFERFYRSPDTRQNHDTGTGLGLAISKEIVELHGGSLGVESVLQEGSTFWFRLPLRS